MKQPAPSRTASTPSWPRVVAFILLAYAITSLFWLWLIQLHGRTPIDDLVADPSALALIYAGALGPTTAAIILTFVFDGRAGLKDLFARLLRFRVSALAWIGALLLPLAAAILAIAIASIAGARLGDVNWSAWMALPFGAVLVAFFAGPLCEEIGWRGYLQLTLLTRLSPTWVALIIGTVWCFWHLPLSLTPGTTPPLQTPLDWAAYWIDTVSASAIILALTVLARQSIAVAMVAHWASNVSLQHLVLPFLPDADEASLILVAQARSAVYVAIALICLFLLERRRRAVGSPP